MCSLARHVARRSPGYAPPPRAAVANADGQPDTRAAGAPHPTCAPSHATRSKRNPTAPCVTAASAESRTGGKVSTLANPMGPAAAGHSHAAAIAAAWRSFAVRSQLDASPCSQLLVYVGCTAFAIAAGRCATPLRCCGSRRSRCSRGRCRSYLPLGSELRAQSISSHHRYRARSSTHAVVRSTCYRCAVASLVGPL